VKANEYIPIVAYILSATKNVVQAVPGSGIAAVLLRR